MNDPMDDQGGVRDRLARCAMLPLRLVLGVAFLHAGVGLFTGWGPFRDAPDRAALERVLADAHADAAAPWLVDVALDHPEVVLGGVAVAQIAVGAAVLVGLLVRLAALGGAALALLSWLTVTWSTSPYHHGQDLPYLAGFLALVLGGAGAVSLDARLRRRDRHSTAPAAPPPGRDATAAAGQP